MSAPTRAGQFVRSDAGRIGMTTDAPQARRIAVQWAARNYPVYEQVEDLDVVQMVVVA